MCRCKIEGKRMGLLNAAAAGPDFARHMGQLPNRPHAYLPTGPNLGMGRTFPPSRLSDVPSTVPATPVYAGVNPGHGHSLSSEGLEFAQVAIPVPRARTIPIPLPLYRDNDHRDPPIVPPDDGAGSGRRRTEDECDRELEFNLGRCEIRFGGWRSPFKAEYKRCTSGAMEAYANCLAGRPMPRFNPDDYARW